MKSYTNGKFRKRGEYDLLVPCPRCGENLPLGIPGALSRGDNKTEVCSQCGMIEAAKAKKDYIKIKKKEEV